jgi:hypothetical protein
MTTQQAAMIIADAAEFALATRHQADRYATYTPEQQRRMLDRFVAAQRLAGDRVPPRIMDYAEYHVATTLRSRLA